MRDLYQKLGLYKSVLSLDGQYTDVPCGDIDVDNLLAGKPPFLDLSAESEVLKKRKLVLGDLLGSDDVLGARVQLNYLIALRQLIEAGFEVYQFRHSEPVQLTEWSVSGVFNFYSSRKREEKEDVALRRHFIREMGVAYDDMAILNASVVGELSKAVKDLVVWSTDVLNIMGRVPHISRCVPDNASRFINVDDDVSIDNRSIPIERCRRKLKVDHDDVKTLLLDQRQHLPSLERLIFFKEFPETAFLQCFPHTPNLRSIVIDRVKKTTLDSLKAALLHNSTVMQHLAVIHVEAFYFNNGLNELISFLRGVPNIRGVIHPLERIDLRQIDFAIDEMALRKLLKGARSLEELVLDKPEHVAIFFELLEEGKINLNYLKSFSLPNHALTIQQAALIMENLNCNNFQVEFKRNALPSQVELYRNEKKEWAPGVYPSRILPDQIHVLKQMPIFTHIHLNLSNPDGEDKISVDHVLNLLAKLPNLKSINLECYPSVLINGRHGLDELAAILRERGLTVEVRDFEEEARQLAAEDERHLQNQDRPQLPGALHDAEAQMLDAEAQMLDADTTPTPKEHHININRVFFSVNGAHPAPNNYRLTVYDRVKINEAVCDASNAFALGNKSDLKLKSVSVTISTEDSYSTLIELKKKTAAAEYYYAKTKLVLSSKWQALPSLNSNEMIQQLHTDPNTAIEIKYSERDNLYYVKSGDGLEKLVAIDYLVEIPPISARPSRDIQSLVNFCQKFKSRALKISKSDPTGQDFLDALIRQKVGACRHRSLVFKALFDDASLRKKIPELNGLNFSGTQARIINNDCHSYVEIKEEGGHWIKCDLGGYDATPKINDAADPLKNRDNLQKAVKAKLSVVIPSPPARDYFPDPKKSVEENPKLYAQHIIAKAESKRLIQCMPEQLDGLSDVLQQTCHSTSKSFYYIHSASDLILNRPHVTLQGDNTGVIEQGHCGPVFRFLSEAHESRVLIVNFSQFSASELVRFNSLLDEKPSIDGIPLPQGTKVIGLIDQTKEADASLYSRFRGAVELCPIDAKNLTVNSVFTEPTVEVAAAAVSVPPLTIEFYGALNWKAKLLGYWSLGEKGLIFVKGALVNAIEQGKPLSQIILNNPPLQDAEFTRFFKEANLRGYIEYEGRRCEWPKPILITKSELTFAHESISSMQRGAPSGVAKIINPALFSQFFKQYELDHHHLIEKSGILDLLPSPKTLALYVSANLSAAQWAQLLADCKLKEIKLTITLAPHVTLPDQLAEKFPVLDRVSASVSPTFFDHCITAADPDFVISRLPKENTVVIDVSELSSSDLLTKTTGKFDVGHSGLVFSQFNGALKTALSENKNIILHGKFSAEMRQRLQAFLFERQQAGEVGSHITVVSDLETAQYFEPFMKVSSDENKLDGRYVEKQALRRNQLGFVGLTTELPPYRIFAELNLSKEAASEFHQARLRSVKDTLDQSPFAFLAGLTGVGKTTFIDNVWKSQYPALHIGVDKIMEWAQDKSGGLKTLFIDEANITSKNWSQFEGLFTNDPPGMMLGNQYVELTKDHKVIFAGNPVKYSDDRRLPSLFARHGNSIVFEPLSPACIYHDVLLPVFDNKDSERSQAIAKPILAIYQYLNSIGATEVLLTPRELKMMTQLAMRSSDPESFAKYYAYQLARPFVPKDKRNVFDKNFKVERPAPITITLPSDSTLTLTGSNRPTAEMMVDFLKMRESLKQPAGLGGLLIEGEPGLGKSELVINCLRAQGFVQRNLNQMVSLSSDEKHFYYLPAGALPSLQRDILIRAFNEGAVVVFDEFNTAASHEGLLNRLLMGQGPNGEAPSKPGFMLIGTQNPAETSAGRTKTSGALLHRMHYHVMPPYTVPEMKQVLQEMRLPQNRIDAIVQQYLEKKQKNPALCFRDVIHAARDDLCGLLGGHEHPTKANLLTLLRDPNLNPDRLEAIYLHKLCDDEIRRLIVFHQQTDRALLNQLVSAVNDFSALIRIASKINNPSILLNFVEKADDAVLGDIVSETNDITVLLAVAGRTKKFDILKCVIEKTDDMRVAKIIFEKNNYLVKRSSDFFQSRLDNRSLVILSALIIIRDQYTGKYEKSLSQLIDDFRKAVLDEKSMSLLIRKRFNLDGCCSESKGRLRTALSFLLDDVENGRSINIAIIQDKISPSESRGFKDLSC